MKKVKLSLIVSVLIRLCLTGTQAQETIPVAGGDALGVTGSASYTVGQIVFTTNSGINGEVSEGVQQPYAVSITKGLENAEKFGIECFIYPNPVTDQLKLRISRNNELLFSNCSYRLYSSSGTLIQSNRITDQESIIQMGYLARSSYNLQVFNQKSLIVEFTIIKN